MNPNQVKRAIPGILLASVVIGGHLYTEHLRKVVKEETTAKENEKDS